MTEGRLREIIIKISGLAEVLPHRTQEASDDGDSVRKVPWVDDWMFDFTYIITDPLIKVGPPGYNLEFEWVCLRPRTPYRLLYFFPLIEGQRFCVSCQGSNQYTMYELTSSDCWEILTRDRVDGVDSYFADELTAAESVLKRFLAETRPEDYFRLVVLR